MGHSTLASLLAVQNVTIWVLPIWMEHVKLILNKDVNLLHGQCFLQVRFHLQPNVLPLVH